MRLSGIKADDLVLCDMRGARFYARVLGRNVQAKRIGVEPICRRNGNVYREVTAHQIVGLWRKAGRSNGRSSNDE